MSVRFGWTRREERRWIRQAMHEAMRELELGPGGGAPERRPAGAPRRDPPPEGSPDSGRRT